jgi:hypothetical protein
LARLTSWNVLVALPLLFGLVRIDRLVGGT